MALFTFIATLMSDSRPMIKAKQHCGATLKTVFEVVNDMERCWLYLIRETSF